MSHHHHKSPALTGIVLFMLASAGAACAGWDLVWSDEFNGAQGTGADAAKWGYNTWNPGTVNNELQKYTSRTQNVFHNGEGQIVIRGLRDNWSGYEYTSGRIESNGKYTFKFGRVECRAILPRGQGSWPAIWLLGTSGQWPACGEIDIMEQWGNNKGSIQCDTHTGTTTADNINATVYRFSTATTAVTDFHTYALDWYADSLVFFVDGTAYARARLSTTSPFYRNTHYLILNVAIGGMMGGTVDNQGGFPMDMVVDYIRVYKQNATGINPGDSPARGSARAHAGLSRAVRMSGSGLLIAGAPGAQFSILGQRVLSRSGDTPSAGALCR